MKNKFQLAPDNYRFTPLHWAVEFNRPQIVECIAKHLKSTNSSEFMEIKNKYGQTALQWSAIEGNIQPLTTLLKYNAKLSATDNDGNTALHLATSNRRQDAVEILLSDLQMSKHAKHDIANVKNASGETARQIALKLKPKNNELLRLFDKYNIK